MDQNTRQPFDTGFNDRVSLRGIHDTYSFQAFIQRTFGLSIFGIHLLPCWSYCGLLLRGSDTGGESQTTRIISRALMDFLAEQHPDRLAYWPACADRHDGPPFDPTAIYFRIPAPQSFLIVTRESHDAEGSCVGRKTACVWGLRQRDHVCEFVLCSARKRNICQKVANQLLQWSMARRSICNQCHLHKSCVFLRYLSTCWTVLHLEPRSWKKDPGSWKKDNGHCRT